MTLNTSLSGVIYHACTVTQYQSVQLQRYDWGKILKTCRVTLAAPLLGLVCHRRLRFDTVYLPAKFDDSSFSCSRNIIRGVKI